VGGLNTPTRVQQIQDGAWPPFEKSFVISQAVSDGLTDRQEIWHGDAGCQSTRHITSSSHGQLVTIHHITKI